MKSVSLVFAIILLFLSQPLSAQIMEEQPKKINIVLGGGMIISPDYHDYLESRFSGSGVTVAGGYGWIGVDAGLQYNVSPNLSIIPEVAFWFNFVDVGSSDLLTNTMIVPGVSARYQFSETPSLFFRGELNLNIPSLDDVFVIEDEYIVGTTTPSGGIGFGGALGYNFGLMAMELGYTYLPVDVFGDLSLEATNMGGLLFRASLSL